MSSPKAIVLAVASIKKLFYDELHPTVRQAVEAWTKRVDDERAKQYAIQLLQREVGPSSESPWEIYAESREEFLIKVVIEGLMTLLREEPELACLDPKYLE